MESVSLEKGVSSSTQRRIKAKECLISEKKMVCAFPGEILASVDLGMSVFSSTAKRLLELPHIKDRVFVMLGAMPGYASEKQHVIFPTLTHFRTKGTENFRILKKVWQR